MKFATSIYQVLRWDPGRAAGQGPLRGGWARGGGLVLLPQEEARGLRKTSKEEIIEQK